MDFMDQGRQAKAENLEVTGVSRSGRIRKKSSKLTDFESPDEVENKYKRRAQPAPFSEQTPKVERPRKISKTSKSRQDDDDESQFDNSDFGQPQQQDSDSDVESYRPNVDDDDQFEVDDDDDEEEDDDDEDFEGNLIVDEKTPTQSLYMMEKNKRRVIIKDGKVVSSPKLQRKDKGKTRFTAYMMWAKEVRTALSRQYAEMDFSTMARRLSEMWATVPKAEREHWKRKAKRESAKKTKAKPDAPLMPSRKFINKKGGPIAPLQHTTPVVLPQKTPPAVTSSPTVQHSPNKVRKVSETSPTNTTGYKATGLAPIDVAAHLKLLGESLSIIGERLQEHEGQIAVSGSLSVLLDSLLCAMGPLLCLTQQIDKMQTNPELLSKILHNTAYIMPGLG